MIEGLASLDRSLFLYLNSLHIEFLDSFMVLISGQLIWIPFIGLFFGYAYKKNGKKATLIFGLFLGLALIASDVTSSYLLKNIVTRLRPCREIDLQLLIYSFGQKCGGRYGFVSSHAANAMALVFFSLRSLNFKTKWIYLIWLIPVLVSYSRIYLGVHYPGDIIGGTIVGIFWAFIFSSMYRSYQGASRPSSQEPSFN
jgi:undecaprenyl-diphosphatase